MKISIRSFLLINLIVVIILITSLTAVGNYYLNQKDIDYHIDELLIQVATSTQALIGESLSKSDIQRLQQALNDMPGHTRHLKKVFIATPTKPLLTRPTIRGIYRDKFEIQIWNEQNQLILHSPTAPKSPLSLRTKPGFSGSTTNGQAWRAFTTINPAAKIKIIVAARQEIRNELAHSIAINDIYILILTIPLLALLTWLIISWGLKSLTRVAKEVKNREPTYLKPVDITATPKEIKPVISAVNQLLERLQQALEREQRFAADAAHELRTPLAALKTQAQVAQQTTDEKEREQALDNVITGVDRSSHIVQQLLTMSRLIPGATHIEGLTPVNLSKLASETIAHLVPNAIEKEIDVELVAEDEHITIIGNMTALSILIRNLVDNAIRYTSPKGEVKIFIEEDAKNVILRVTDTGPGIPKELRSRVFERFFRALGNRGAGSGLGLAIVQQIVNLHHATLELHTPAHGYGLEISIKFSRVLT